jgi:molybdate transport system regulatory protein
MAKRLDNLLVRPRLYLGAGLSIGPGKIELLRQIGETRSISAAARELNIPYKRAWLLVDSLNQGFGRPVITSATGGKGGGGATLTPLGTQLIAAYDALQADINLAAQEQLAAMMLLVGKTD